MASTGNMCHKWHKKRERAMKKPTKERQEGVCLFKAKTKKTNKQKDRSRKSRPHTDEKGRFEYSEQKN